MKSSIYSGSRNHVSDVQVQDAAANSAEWPRPTRHGPNPAELRRAVPYNRLFGNTADWILALPLAYRPLHLARQYARIANQIHLTWNDSASCRAYFEDLLLDRRGNRQGFPVDIMRELQQLNSYYERFAPDSLQLEDLP